MTTFVDLGNRRVDGGYFLLRKQKPQPFHMQLASAGEQYRFCFTYQESEPSIEQELLALIRNARRKIFITSFRIGGTRLFQALVEAAARLRGGVYVISALDDESLARGLEEAEDDSKEGLASLRKNFSDMTRAGIYVRGHSACHAKFAVIDDEAALVCSANFEDRAFQVTGECGVAVQDPQEAGRLARLFTRLWHSGCEWEMPPGHTSLVQKRKPQVSPCNVPPPPDGKNSILWTDRAEQHILNEIREVIGQAERELFLASFSLTQMTQHPELLLDPIAQLLEKRKVDVRLFIRGRNNVAGHRRDAQRLHEMGVSIFADSLNHAKAAIADRSTGALFSANFDAQHGLTNGVETGIRLDRTAALADALAYFDHAVQHADLEFVSQPTLLEMNHRLACRWRKQWPLPDAVSVECTDPVWNQFVSDTESGPVLYETAEGSELVIFAGTSTWKLSNASKARYRIRQESGKKQTADRLEEWFAGRELPDTRRGFVPARFQRVSLETSTTNP